MTHAEVEVNGQGRVTIPAEMRRHLGLRAGSRLIAREEDGRIVLEQRAHLLARLQEQLGAEQAAAGHHPGGVVDALIAERRGDAVRDGSG